MVTGQKEVTQKRNRTTVNSVLLNIPTLHIISEEKSQNKKFFVFFYSGPSSCSVESGPKMNKTSSRATLRITPVTDILKHLVINLPGIESRRHPFKFWNVFVSLKLRSQTALRVL